MPRKKSWRRSLARSRVLDGVLPDGGPTCSSLHTDSSVMMSQRVCLANDEGLTTPTSSHKLVPLVDVSTMPSELQGYPISDGGKVHPTCLSNANSDGHVHGCTLVMTMSSEQNMPICSQKLPKPCSKLSNVPICCQTSNIHLCSKAQLPTPLCTTAYSNTPPCTTFCSNMPICTTSPSKDKLGHTTCTNKNETKHHCDSHMNVLLPVACCNSGMNQSSELQRNLDVSNNCSSDLHCQMLGHPSENNNHFQAENKEKGSVSLHENFIVLGSFSQNDKRFSVQSRGTQCTVNALCSLIHAKYAKISNTKELDQVLIDGDVTYNKILFGLKANGSFKNRLLNFDELPSSVTLLEKHVNITKFEVLSGACTQTFGNLELPSLYQAVYSSLQMSPFLLVMVGSICSAVYKEDDTYYFFDSHGHGKNGLSVCNGTSMQASFDSVEDLVGFMYNMYESMHIDLSTQYDILPVQFQESLGTISQPVSDCTNVRSTSETSDEWQMAKAQQRKSRQKPENALETGFHSESGNDCYAHTTLIGKYFKDQRQRNDACKSKKEKNRKEYMRLYKQKKRSQLSYRLLEKEKTYISMTKARQSADFVSKENEAKRAKRQLLDQQLKEKQRSLASKKKARESDYFVAKENEAKRTKRQSDDQKVIEKQRTLTSMRKARESDNFVAKENEAKRTKRQSDDQKVIEKQRSLTSKKKARESDNFVAKENESKRTKRQSDDQKVIEKQRSLASKKKARESLYYRKQEKEKKRRARLVIEFQKWEKEQKREKRKNQNYKQKEIEFQKKSKRAARSHPHILEKERIKKQNWRSVQQNKAKEIISNALQKSLKRRSTEVMENELVASKRRKYGSNISDCVSIFHKNISVGPVYVCCCCEQTWFKQSVSNISSLSPEQKAKFLTSAVSVDGKQWVCCTCKNSILNNKIPKLSLLNGMCWPQKPNELNLFPLEERLIALRIPFMQIRELPRGRQLSIKGNIVNVPVNIQPVVNALPRPFDENITVAVKLKKKMSFKSHVFSENVRPTHVLVALHWLMKNSALYKNANVDIDEQWITKVTDWSNNTLKDFMSSDDDESTACQPQPLVQELYDSDAEETQQENVGNIDTLLDDANNENKNSTFTFAPGEGQTPLSIYQDKDSEYLSFPTIYCGQKRPENEDRLVPVYYSDIAKWELRSIDRRAANCVPNIFFKLKKIQMKQLNDKVSLAVRRCQGNLQNMTASKAKDYNNLNSLVRKDEGYYIFKQLRNSPAYLECRKKDVFAMIRQLGLPTWFMSLSSADTRWTDLLRMLVQLNFKKEYTEEQIQSLTWEEKTKLIQKDPVTCSRYFDHRVQEFINTILKSDHKPLGIITDYFYRVEFQQRGSPHIHMIVWVENAPKFGTNTDDDIAAYVDEYLTCSNEDEEINNLIDLQIHNHSRTCNKKQDKICRFGYPLPPLPKTMVLQPLDENVDEYRKKYKDLQSKMNSEKTGYDMTFHEFLASVVQLNEDDYVKCIRSSLTSPKVFLKRSPKQLRMNLYNKTVLIAWKANIDIQFVLDPYACAMYIVSYISKSQRGMSNLMYAAAKEARNGNLDIKRQVRHIGNVFSNSVEVGAQEAVYLVLQMPLTKCSRDVVFINTSPTHERIQLLKPFSALNKLPDQSTDVLADNIIKRYSKRPSALNSWCLADYVSQLDISFPKQDLEDDAQENADNVENEHFDDQENFDSTILKLRNGMTIRRRKNPKIIRYVRFNKKADPENYYREKLLLFTPWRNEETDLLDLSGSYEKQYMQKKNIIDFKCNQYEHHADELDLAREKAQEEHDAYDELAPSTQQMEGDTAEEEIVESEAFIYFNPDRVSEHRDYDIGYEIGCSISNPQINPQEKLLNDDEYRKLLRCLNGKQKQFYNHVIHWIKTKDAPLYAFLSGGAGVGKSIVIKALYQTLYRILNLKEGEDPDDIRVLLCAFTGKAAFNINGSTISTAFKQKYKQSNQTLTCDTLNTFRSKYKSLSVVIIDEISMVSNTMLNFINQRLQELKGTNEPFGGISILAVGDLYQLKPVSGNWIFNDLTLDASALARNLWKDYFQIFELTEIMRQKDDIEFSRLLNRLRVNKLTENDKEKIKQCHIQTDSQNYDRNAPHLFAENFYMHAFNDNTISSKNSAKVNIPCHDSVINPKLSKEKQDLAILKLPTDPNKTANLHCSLTIVIDMIYDLTVNVDTEDGLANGASCIVKQVEHKQVETSRPSIIWVKFEEEKAGKETRIKYKNKGFYHNNIHETWTPIFDIERSFVYNKKTFQRIQFPLQPSAGRSVHRAQGSTLEKVVIDLSQRKVRKVPHLHYVALSRVKTSSRLQILNFNEQALCVDEQVDKEMERMRQTALLNLCFVPFETLDLQKYFKTIFNNCRSLHLHIDDIKSDNNVLSSHIAGFSETRLWSRDKDENFMIEGFQLIRNDETCTEMTTRPSHGLAVYVRHSIKIKECHMLSENPLEFIFLSVECQSLKWQIAVIYKSPSTSFSAFKATVRNHLSPLVKVSDPLIILGDFNSNINQTESLSTWMVNEFSSRQMINTCTTDYGSILDLIFTNRTGITGVVETYWSDHKMIYIGSLL